MTAMADPHSLRLLAELLTPKHQDADDENELVDVLSSPYANPGAIGSSHAGTASTTSGDLQTQSKDSATDKAIWRPEEVAEGDQYDYDDPREQPVYEMVFQQSVATEDAFLGMGSKTPLTASCEDLVVRIHLPGSEYKDVDLIIKEKFLDCRTPKYRLGLHLPHPVASDCGRARWLASKFTLEVTLRLQREYDFLHQ